MHEWPGGHCRTFQNIRLFAEMTALENVMVGRHIRTKSGLLGAVLRTKSSRKKRLRLPSVRKSCWTTWALAGLPTTRPGT